MNMNLTWIISIILSVLYVKSSNCDHEKQYNNLISFYNSTNGQNWIHKWNFIDPNYWYVFSNATCFFPTEYFLSNETKKSEKQKRK